MMKRGPVVESTVLMDAQSLQQNLRRLAQQVASGNTALDNMVFLGILRRGRPLADRLAQLIVDMTGVRPPVGSLATTLYRDDYATGVAAVKPHGETHFDFILDGKTVLLVDDVLAAGRTIRAALDEVMDYGRPARIQLLCLVDRGGRELPIQADYLGWNVATEPEDWISVHLREVDGEDAVLLERRAADRPSDEGT